jgi:hypothetical protein
MYLRYSFNVFDVRFEWIAARALCEGGGGRGRKQRREKTGLHCSTRTFVFITVYWFEKIEKKRS